MRPLVSVIIPAWDEESRLPATLSALAQFVESSASQSFSLEAIVVDNASTDHTYLLATAFSQSHPYLRVIQETRRGKGAAVRAGMFEGTGQYLFICDADLAMPMTELPNFLPPQLNDFSVAIGSREALGAIRHNEPVYRHYMGRIFTWVTKLLALQGFEDTQCGYKCFQRDVALDLFSAQTMDGWAFDVEVLYIARRRGYRIVEVPIQWYYRPNSRVSPISDSLKMIREVWRVRQNGRAGIYDQPRANNLRQARTDSR
ncbi:MAG: glycosyltransferase family 2 protein [Chloroflexi bacterium]|nr:glycosyltransferase family 2 protein [Chloroflexota bacterium]